MIIYISIGITLLLCALTSAMIGARKGSGGKGFLLGLVFGFFGISLAVLIRGDRKICKKCKSFIHRDASLCRYCGSVADPVETQATPDPVSGFCVKCGETISPGASSCVKCGAELSPENTLRRRAF